MSAFEEVEMEMEGGKEQSSPRLLLKEIMRKWLTQGTFIRFMDGNKGNVAASNLRVVSLRDALFHIDDWVCDWDADLTDDECSIVEAVPDEMMAGKFEMERDGTQYFTIAPTLLDEQTSSHSHVPGEDCPVCANYKSLFSHDHLESDSDNPIFLYMYSTTERGPLSNTALIVVNVSYRAASKCEKMATSFQFLHSRATSGAPVESLQIVGGEVPYMLVRACAKDFAKLRAEGRVGIVSDAFRAAEQRGEARILFAVPLYGVETKNEATFHSMQAIVADFSSHYDEHSGLWGVDEGSARRIDLGDTMLPLPRPARV